MAGTERFGVREKKWKLRCPRSDARGTARENKVRGERSEESSELRGWSRRRPAQGRGAEHFERVCLAGSGVTRDFKRMRVWPQIAVTRWMTFRVTFWDEK